MVAGLEDALQRSQQAAGGVHSGVEVRTSPIGAGWSIHDYRSMYVDTRINNKHYIK